MLAMASSWAGLRMENFPTTPHCRQPQLVQLPANGVDLTLIDGLKLTAAVVERSPNPKIVGTHAEMFRIQPRTGGNQHRHRRQFILHDQVCCESGAQDHPSHLGDILPCQQSIEGADHRVEQSLGISLHLDIANQPLCPEQYRIRMGAANVQSDNHKPTPQ